MGRRCRMSRYECKRHTHFMKFQPHRTTATYFFCFLLAPANSCRHPHLRFLEFSTTNTVGIRKHPAIVLLEYCNLFCTRHFAPLQLRLFLPFAFSHKKGLLRNYFCK
ncbi:hypothetical protein K450DRAFT_247535 [Umbelopsis ramanniana AG]|uniref:Uncharacterized protein n=1 Tax=Umbelopsis ramanniana AG TaxID=1314678 RepID=A0AAD5E6M6_UMBRA|nr:uncharacterized protein K450DRAFT_247535 [Umbelopsis ramanniana AG]KAI8578361.1 hypothetical protein K450DRAFT_247535 [Umbelopsis ramanniana AG]